MDEQDKKKLVGRYMRGVKHEVSYEEQKARKHRKRGGNKRRGPRSRDWDESEDEAAGFERIQRRKVDAAATHVSNVTEDQLEQATIVAVHTGRVQLSNGNSGRIAPHLAADPTVRFAVGDEVLCSDRCGQQRIERLLPRRSVLARTDPGQGHRQLVLAANVDLGIIVVAAKDPPLRLGLIDRFLLALGAGNIAPLVCVNKVDLCSEAELEATRTLVAHYASVDVLVEFCSASAGVGIDALRAAIATRTCVFVGHSGVGKSSLLNAVDPNGQRTIGAVREFDGRGRHTTTASSLRELDAETRVIDTPGIRAFGLGQLEAETIRAAFPEFQRVGRCRFADCTHVHEPDCAVQAAVQAGNISEARYAAYRRILDD